MQRPFLWRNIGWHHALLARIFLGIILLGVATLVPFGVHAGAYSWTLYIPLLTLLLGVTSEACGQRGWRYHLMLLSPLYALILIGWAARLIPLLRARPG